MVDVKAVYERTIELNKELMNTAKEQGMDTKPFEDAIAQAEKMYNNYLKEDDLK